MVGGDWSADYSGVHCLRELPTTISPWEPGKFQSVATASACLNTHPQGVHHLVWSILRVFTT